MQVALGFQIHTGWAALVAVAGEPAKLDIVLRRRLELLPADNSIPRFVYHQAAEMELPAARKLISAAQKAAAKAAGLAIRSALESLPQEIDASVAAIITGSGTIPRELSKILTSHMLLHAAEGILFQEAVSAGCKSCGIGSSTISERELWPKAAEVCGVSEDRLRVQIEAIKKSVGPPWSADQKTAAAAALWILQNQNRKGR
jgi:hypothetical protein